MGTIGHAFKGAVNEECDVPEGREMIRVQDMGHYVCFKLHGPRNGVKLHRHWEGISAKMLACALNLKEGQDDD